jgi:hypothetical protein
MRIKTHAAIALTMLFATSAVTADDKLANEAVCATVQVHACVLYEPCEELHPGAMNTPDIFRVDLDDEEITARRTDGTYSTVKIESRTETDTLVILQGIQAVSERLQAGAGWTMAISRTTGRMALSVATDETSYSLLGNCQAL